MSPTVGFTHKRTALAVVSLGILALLTPLPLPSGTMPGERYLSANAISPHPDFSLQLRSHSAFQAAEQLKTSPSLFVVGEPTDLQYAAQAQRPNNASSAHSSVAESQPDPHFEVVGTTGQAISATQPVSPELPLVVQGDFSGRNEALMKAGYAWQRTAEDIYMANYRLEAAATAIETARTERDAALQQVQTLTAERDSLAATNRSLEAQITTAAAPQPPPVIETTPPPLPTPVVTANPEVQVAQAPSTEAAPQADLVPAMVALVTRNLQVREAAELRSEDQHTVTSETASQLALQGPHSSILHHVDSYSGTLSSTGITLQADQAPGLPAELHNALEGHFGPAVESTGSSTTYYGPGMDVIVTTSNSEVLINILHTGLGLGPIQVFDAPPEAEVEPAPLVTRYD